MPEQDSSSEIRRDSLTEAYTPTGKHEFRVTSGKLFIGDPMYAAYRGSEDQEDKIKDLIRRIEDSLGQGRQAFLPKGVWIYTQADQGFDVYKDENGIRLVDEETNSDAMVKGEQTEKPIAGVGVDQAQIMIGDPKSLRIREDESIFDIPNGIYTCKITLEDFGVGIRNIELRRLQKGGKAPEDDIEVVPARELDLWEFNDMSNPEYSKRDYHFIDLYNLDNQPYNFVIILGEVMKNKGLPIEARTIEERTFLYTKSNEVKAELLDILDTPEARALGFLVNWLQVSAGEEPDMENCTWDDKTKRKVLAYYLKLREESLHKNNDEFFEDFQRNRDQYDEVNERHYIKKRREITEIGPIISQLLQISENETLTPLTPDDIRDLMEEIVQRKITQTISG